MVNTKKRFSEGVKEITKLADLSAQTIEDIRQLINQLRLPVEQVEEIVNETIGISNIYPLNLEDDEKFNVCRRENRGISKNSLKVFQTGFVTPLKWLNKLRFKYQPVQI